MSAGLSLTARLPDGGRLAYAWQGATQAPPVLLLRPLGGSMALWGLFGERLARDFRVLSFDYRGVGESSPAPRRVTAGALAHDALGLLDHLAVDRVHVFGLSLGAMVATWLAHTAPDRVVGLCVASVPVRGRSLLGRDFGAAIRLGACFAQRPSRVEPCLVRHVLSPEFVVSQPAEVLRVLNLILHRPTPPLTLLKYAAAAAVYDAAQVLPSLRAPTLVLAGDTDRRLGPGVVRNVAALISGASFEIIAGAGHDVTLEAPQRTAELAATFFRNAR